MIIDTRFNIDDEIWIPHYIYAIKRYEPRCFRILEFRIYANCCYAFNEYAEILQEIDKCYINEADCQITCDELNELLMD